MYEVLIMTLYLRYGDKSENVKFLQRALNEKLSLRLKADGQFGKLTEEALRIFQTNNKLFSNGVYAQNEINLLQPFIDGKYLSEKEIEIQAKLANYPVSIIKALRDVEARAEGFLYDGRPIILFERHKFYLYLSKIKGEAFAKTLLSTNSDICNPERGGYKGYEEEWTRLARAMSFCNEAAILSTSFGLFQIMGFNYKVAGYPTVDLFYNDMCFTEKNHLKAFINFIINNPGLSTAVKQRNHKRIALLYNGAAADQNDYANKLIAAESKYI